MDPLSHGSLSPRILHPMDRPSHGSPIPWIPHPMDPSSHGSLTPRIPHPMDLDHPHPWPRFPWNGGMDRPGQIPRDVEMGTPRSVTFPVPTCVTSTAVPRRGGAGLRPAFPVGCGVAGAGLGVTFQLQELGGHLAAPLHAWERPLGAGLEKRDWDGCGNARIPLDPTGSHRIPDSLTWSMWISLRP